MSSDNLNSEGSICEKPVFQRVRRNELRPPPPDSSISGVRRIRLQPPVIFQGIRRIKLRPHLAELEHLRRGGAEILLPPLHKASDPLQSPLLMEWLHLHLHLHCSSQQGLCLSLLLSESQRNVTWTIQTCAAKWTKTSCNWSELTKDKFLPKLANYRNTSMHSPLHFLQRINRGKTTPELRNGRERNSIGTSYLLLMGLQKRGEAASLAAEKGNDAGLSLASPIAQPQIPNPPVSSFPSLCVEKKSSGQWRSGDEWGRNKRITAGRVIDVCGLSSLRY